MMYLLHHEKGRDYRIYISPVGSGRVPTKRADMYGAYLKESIALAIKNMRNGKLPWTPIRMHRE